MGLLAKCGLVWFLFSLCFRCCYLVVRSDKNNFDTSASEWGGVFDRKHFVCGCALLKCYTFPVKLEVDGFMFVLF